MNLAPIERTFFNHTKRIDIVSSLYHNLVELSNINSINRIDSTSVINDLDSQLKYLRNKFLHKILIHYPNLDDFLNQYFKIDRIDHRLKSLGEIFHASPDFKDNYKEDKFLNIMYNIYNKENNIKNKLKILYLIFCYLDKNEVKKIILSQDNISDYIKIYKLITKICNNFTNWNKFIETIDNNNFNDIFEMYNNLIKIVRREFLEFSFIPSLSSGEEKLLYLLVNIYDFILNAQALGKKEFILIIDEYHKYKVIELITKRKQYPDTRIKELALLTQKTVEEVKQDLFGEYIFEEKDLHKRPLSKLIKDIAQELGLV